MCVLSGCVYTQWVCSSVGLSHVHVHIPQRPDALCRFQWLIPGPNNTLSPSVGQRGRLAKVLLTIIHLLVCFFFIIFFNHVPYAQTDPRFLFEKRRGQPQEFWSLVSTIDGSTLPQDCAEEQLCVTRSNWLNIQI